MLDALREHPVLLAWMAGISAAMLVVGVVVAPWIVARLPVDHFVRKGPPPDSWRAHHPVVRLLLRGLKNALGAAFVLAGVAMLVLPGQGILTILLGLGLLDLPGKRAVELALARRGPVRRALQWLRRRAGRPPLRIP